MMLRNAADVEAALKEAVRIEIEHCQDCRFWERRAVGNSSSFGFCHMLSDVKIDVGVALIRGPWGGVGEKVSTGEDFGCVQFEAREG